MTSRPWIDAAAQSCDPQGSLLKHAQVTVGPLHGRSIGTHDGSSGGTQQLPEREVPEGHCPPSGDRCPASGIKHVPGPGG